ncbi:MAG: phenylalanine--tRNA ligase subunit beta, partial [Planctomycetota bacterium]|nr:phenylalanine--tRNA ligase subunit beta [Planctomycetota bacterium]
ELDLGADHEGIWELPEEAPVGSDLASALGLEDWVLEIDNKSLTHRPDLWGHRGLAREVAAIFGRPLLPLDTSIPACGAGPPPQVTIEESAAELCPRYLALALDGVRVEPSPLWLRCLLAAAGQRPLDLLVDLSNFVMLDLGQPNHLFDRAAVADGIEVRRAAAAEEMVTLDEGRHTLGSEDLLICSGQRPVALAGVMGGADSKVAPETRELLLEVANFHGTTVRRTAMRTGLRSESSARFEKNLDGELVPAAAGHLVRTLLSIQPEVTLPSPPMDVGVYATPDLSVELSPEMVRERLGVELDDNHISTSLASLGFDITAANGVYSVGVPSWRATKDISIAEDLVEEVGRLHGYDNIPPRPLVGELTPPLHDARRTLVEALQDRLAGGARFHEVLGYSFLHAELCERLGICDQPHVRLVNPVAEGEDRVRRSVLPSLLGRLEINRRQRERVAIFEIGKGYLPEEPGDRGQPREIHELGLAWSVPPSDKGAAFDDGAFSRLAGVMEDLLAQLGFGCASFVGLAPDAGRPAWAHPGRGALCSLADGTAVGFIAELEPGLHRPLGLMDDLVSDVACATLSLDALLAAEKPAFRPRKLPRFPETKVDVALACPAAMPAGDLAAMIERAGKGLVGDLELFDLYRGANLPTGQKSLAWHLRLRAEDRTLGENDVARFLGRLERAAAAADCTLRRD